MKTVLKIKSFAIIIFMIAFIGNTFQVKAQEEKQSLSVTLMYYKLVGEKTYSYITVKTSFKDEDGWQDAKDVPFEIVKLGDQEVSLGTGMTDKHGKAKVMLPEGSVGLENSLEFRVANNPKFEDTTESLEFKDVDLTATLKVEDSVKQITAILKDMSGAPIADEGLRVVLKRLNKGLNVGEDYYYTDENGMIVADITDDYQSFDGKLIFEVRLEEHGDYGNVFAQMNADFGKVAKNLSTFDKRTLWSPRVKTPLFFLIFPNIILLGIFGVFVYLIMNLIKISKSKN